MNKYVIFTDSSCDLSTTDRKKYSLEYFYFGLVVDGKEYYADLDWQLYKPEEFYGWLSQGKKIKTTQVGGDELTSKVKVWFEKGYDIIYLGCSSALTGSLNIFNIFKPELETAYPGRKMIGIDTLTSSCTLGILCIDAAKKRDEGLTIDELAEWVETHKFFYNQFATVDTLKFLKNSGRIKGIAAFIGDIVGVKPIFISDRKGNNFTIAKVRGTKASVDALYQGIVDTIDKDRCKTIYIGQAMCMDRALALKERFEKELNIPAVITWIGPIVGTTCGPGVIGVFCRGKEVTRFDGDGIPVK